MKFIICIRLSLFMQGTTSFYQDNQSLFAQLQKRVEVAVRKEVLDEYQKKNR